MQLRIVKNTCAKTLISLALGLAVFITAVGPVPTKAAESHYIEVLETTSVMPNGSNILSFTVSPGAFRITLPSRMSVAKVDLLLSYKEGDAPTRINIRVGSSIIDLTLAHIDTTLTRAYGTIPVGLYDSLALVLYKDSTQFTEYQLLSFRVSSVASTELNASAYAMINGQQYNTPFFMSYVTDNGTNVYKEFQFPIEVTDWQKFDSITVSGSVGYMALNSIRCTIGGLGLPYEMSYAVSNSTGGITESSGWNEMKYYSYDESYKGSSESSSFIYPDYHGKVLFTVTIDLSALDRSSTENLIIYFTGLANETYGYTVQVLRVTGTVEIAETSDVSWWLKFVAFMNKLFGADSSAADDFQTEMEQQGQEVEDAADQVEQVTKPPIEDVEVSIDSYVDPAGITLISTVFTDLFGNNLLLGMVMISFIVGLVGFIIF